MRELLDYANYAEQAKLCGSTSAHLTISPDYSFLSWALRLYFIVLAGAYKHKIKTLVQGIMGLDRVFNITSNSYMIRTLWYTCQFSLICGQLLRSLTMKKSLMTLGSTATHFYCVLYYSDTRKYKHLYCICILLLPLLAN